MGAASWRILSYTFAFHGHSLLFLRPPPRSTSVRILRQRNRMLAVRWRGETGPAPSCGLGSAAGERLTCGCGPQPNPLKRIGVVPLWVGRWCLPPFPMPSSASDVVNTPDGTASHRLRLETAGARIGVFHKSQADDGIGMWKHSGPPRAAPNTDVF